MKSVDGTQDLQLVFSDEFNIDGRSFWPAMILSGRSRSLAGPTGDFEWYSPQAVTTADGNLVITATRSRPTTSTSAVVSLPHGTSSALPAATSRRGFNSQGAAPCRLVASRVDHGQPRPCQYGATTQGTWPYAYDACDVGTLKNQTYPDGSGPEGALLSGNTVFNEKYDTTSISWQPGQRLSAARVQERPSRTQRFQRNFVGRSAPEIDIIEAQVGNGIGGVSQSGQWDARQLRLPAHQHHRLRVHLLPTSAQLNSYQGNVLQQSASGVANTLQTAYQYSGGDFAVYGFEYKAGFDGYIDWVNNGQRSWRLNSGALAADPRVNISADQYRRNPCTS